MSILKNFKNPWEADKGVLETNVLDTNVLETNQIEEVKKLKKPKGFIFGYGIPNNTLKELYSVKELVKKIFKKNGILVDIEVISSNKARKKEFELGDYEAIIGVQTKDHTYSIGLSVPVVQTQDFFSAEFKIFHSENDVASYVKYDTISYTGAESHLYKYKAAFYIAHEFLHQFLVKAYAQFYGQDFSERGYFSPDFGFNKEIKIISTDFNIHENDNPNLNTDGELLGTLHNIEIGNTYQSKLQPEETIIKKHKILLKAWLGDFVSFTKLSSYNYTN